MINKKHARLSIAKQCKLLALNRSSYYYQPKGASSADLALMQRIDELYLQCPFYGSRQMLRHLKRSGAHCGRHRVRRLGISAIYQKPKTTLKNPEHKVYPYLLRGVKVSKPNQVWCSDITYIKLKTGFMYLMAIKDWYSRKLLSWRLSNTLDAEFCVAALEEAIRIYGCPEIFNTDQGSQYTSSKFTGVLEKHKIKISMDGKGSYMDNIFIERLWRSLKYECIYTQELTTAKEAKTAITEWINFYNETRPHSTFAG